MGKNKIIKSLGKCIGNIIVHKILIENTNKPESRNYLENEIIEYSANVFEKAGKFNWNKKDTEKIKELSKIRAENLSKNYPDVIFSDDEIEKLIKDIINELIIE